MILENKHLDEMMVFLTRNHVTDYRLKASVKVEAQEILSDLLQTILLLINSGAKLKRAIIKATSIHNVIVSKKASF